MAFKHAKKKQTDYNIGGKAISDTAIPLYQKNLTRMDEYLSDPTARQDMYLNKYYGADNVDQSDFLRNYKRAMGQTTANNYSATNGGYSSSGQRAYDDNQRYWNDYASRLRSQGVTDSYNMANQDYQNMVDANRPYFNAYSLGEAYSNVDQYNDAVNKANGNWYSGVMSSVGKGLQAIPNPWTQAIGAGLSAAGSLTNNGAEDLLNSMNSSGNIRGGEGGSSNKLGGAFQNGYEGIGTLINDWKTGTQKYYPKWAGGKGIQPQKVNTGGGSLFSSNNPWTATVRR